MEPALTLKEVFAGLAGHGDAGGLAGHEGLPGDLLITAIGSYADTAPAEVAEHLAGFVAAPTDAADGLHLLTAVPVETPEGEVTLDGGPDDLGDLDGLGHADNLDFLDHAPIAEPEAVHVAPDAHDADFGQPSPAQAPQADDPSPGAHDGDLGDDVLDDGHISIDDLSDDALTLHEAGIDAHEPLHAADEPEAEHHHDDGHHDPGPDHF